MTINRRRAPSSAISSKKKKDGHLREDDYAKIINGIVISGTQKGDVKDSKGNLHSVKSGKKWQIFLYGYNRICNSLYLNILKNSLEAFPENPDEYFEDRIKCISYKENYVKKYGREAAKMLINDEISKELGVNTYIESKNSLSKSTTNVSVNLGNKEKLRNFLCEALFNNGEVNFLAIKDTTYIKDNMFKVFSKEDVLDVLTPILEPATSSAGRVAEDYNVDGQKTLLKYRKNGKEKNIVEIEIRNDSNIHYKQVRFNMYSSDTLALLINSSNCSKVKEVYKNVFVYGKAIDKF
jgi:hypothetical protein